jgi:hypothetical protein
MLDDIPKSELKDMVETLNDELEYLEQSVEGNVDMELLTRMINMSRVYIFVKIYLELRNDS